MLDARCQRCAERVPWMSFFGNLGLTVYKLVVGILGGSAALVADGFHSAADVVGSVSILFSTRVAARPADAGHHYGHGKAEFIGAAFVYVVITLLSFAIIINAIAAIIDGRPSPPHIVTLAAGVVSVFTNLFMHLYGRCAGDRANSPAIMADSFENRTDAISSAAAVLGIALAILVHPICDPLAAAAVGVIILWNGLTQLKEAMSGLMDRSLPADRVRQIERVALAQPEVLGVAFLRTRQIGSRFWVDLGIRVRSELTVTNSDALAGAIRAAVMERHEVEHMEVYVLPLAVRTAGRGNCGLRLASG